MPHITVAKLFVILRSFNSISFLCKFVTCPSKEKLLSSNMYKLKIYSVCKLKTYLVCKLKIYSVRACCINLELIYIARQ